MTHKVKFLFEQMAEVRPPKQVVAQGTDFGLQARIHNHEYGFAFSWNGTFGYYSLDVFRDGIHLQKLYPQPDEHNDPIRNFDPDSTLAPDAIVVLADVSLEESQATPDNLGVTHTVLVLLGRVRRF